MTGSWVKIASPPTQVLAQAVYDSGKIAGIKYGSASAVYSESPTFWILDSADSNPSSPSSSWHLSSNNL